MSNQTKAVNSSQTDKIQNLLNSNGNIASVAGKTIGIRPSLRRATAARKKNIMIQKASTLNRQQGDQKQTSELPEYKTELDPKKKLKLIQDQLLLYLHSYHCELREKEAKIKGKIWQQCAWLHCQTIKDVLKHMSTCNDDHQCSVKHCSSTREISSHWKRCVNEKCNLCVMIRFVEKKCRSHHVGANVGEDEFWCRVYYIVVKARAALATKANQGNANQVTKQAPIPNSTQQVQQPTSTLQITKPAPRQDTQKIIEPKSRKLYTQSNPMKDHLVLFLHAQNCQHRENQSPCATLHCRMMKMVQNHMSTCTSGWNCTIPHCSSSQMIFGHYQNCVKKDCCLCPVVKKDP